MRTTHYLTKNAQTEMPSNILLVDTEAAIEHLDNGQIHQTFRLGYAIFIRKVRGDWQDQEYPLRTVEDFHSLLDKLQSQIKKGRLYIFAHNMAYDYTILKLDTYISSRKLTITTRAIQTVFIINAEKHTDNKTEFTLTFASSTNYYASSLKTLGEKLGCLKMEVKDFENVSNDELMVYCRQDTIILTKLIKEHIKFLVENNLGNFKLTIASQALTAFRHRFLNKNILIHTFEDILDMEQESYRGGRCEAFYLGKLEDIYKLDINSMYPYVMRNNKYPLSPLTKRKVDNLSISQLEKSIEDDYFILADCNLKMKEPAIGFKSDKLLFPVGKFKQIITSPEIEYILNNPSCGEITNINYAVGYNQDFIFNDYVDYFYSLKVNSKDEASKESAKKFLNSLYGKFAQKAYPVEELVTDEDIKKSMNFVFNETGSFIMNNIDLETNEKIRFIRLGEDIYGLYPNEEKLSDLSIPIISSAVTSFARIYLFKLMKIAGLNNIFYCDTDSLFTNLDGYNNLKNYINEDKIGYLKLEDYGNTEIFGLKNYTFNGELKLKGIKKDAIQMPNGGYQQYQFCTKASRYIKGVEDGTVLLEPIIKNISYTYNKGTVEGNKVLPFILDDNV